MAAAFGRSSDNATATETGQKATEGKKAHEARVRPGRRSGSNGGPTVIAPGTEVEGDIRSEGPIHVEGRLQGGVRSEGTVQVDSAGTVEGDIDSAEVILSGEVRGNVSARQRVRLQDGCRVSGDIRAERIQIDEGARMDGHLQMGGTSE